MSTVNWAFAVSELKPYVDGEAISSAHAVLNMTQQAAWCQDIVLQQTMTPLLKLVHEHGIPALSSSSLLQWLLALPNNMDTWTGTP